MRLLERQPDGDLVQREFTDKDAPPYAILSHTWLENNEEEVTFQDVVDGSGKRKAGWEKIAFCSNRAAADGLRYSWIDTCCINKKIYAELQKAISSMFRWYQRSTKCYVYLSDVSFHDTQAPWEQAFQESRWFTRGWTLPELLAPASIEFFSRDAHRLGDMRSLERQIHEITAIPVTALRGKPLYQFSVNDRMRWKESRDTTKEEDLAYSLLGIFDVEMPLEYGEGRVAAFERLRKEIDKVRDCIKDIRLIDPVDHKQDIEDKRGGLLKDSYRWIIEHSDFQNWRSGEQKRLLWIEGDPGKGKTMLLCGIIDELKESMNKTDLLSFYFLEATNSQVNDATAVLRGLIYMLVCQQPSLTSYIRNKYEHSGKALFEDANAWFALCDIFRDILHDNNLNKTFLIIDALDECSAADLPKLLGFIVKVSSISPRVKWLVSSRRWPSIERHLDEIESKVRVRLELNSQSISDAVGGYIQYKVGQLKYDANTRDVVLGHLSLNANDTFLWVALVCQRLQNTPRALVRTSLKMFPPGLDSFYGRMMRQISEAEGSELCKRILALVSTTYEPITLFELSSLIELLESVSDDRQSLEEMIGLCGSFLAIRNDTIYFVHQSAKDYLLEKASAEIFPHGMKEMHQHIFSRSLQVMSRMLRRDVYDLGRPGYPIEHVQRRNPDPLAACRYSCLYWVDHLWELESPERTDGNVDLQDGGSVDFFVKEKYLYWLEALSLCKSMSKGVLSMVKLEALAQGRLGASAFAELVTYARRFILYNKQAIEISPLQAYYSALTFSPSGSLIRRHFRTEEPRYVEMKPPAGDKWSACLHTLEGHKHYLNAVAFSADGEKLASASNDGTIKIWDLGRVQCVQTLTEHNCGVTAVAFSKKSALLASASIDGTIKTWNTDNGKCVQTLTTHNHNNPYGWEVAFSPDGTKFVSWERDNTVGIWNTSSGVCVLILEHHSRVCSAALSFDGAKLASASDATIKIWDSTGGQCLQTLTGHHIGGVDALAFSHDGKLLVSASRSGIITIWNVDSGEHIRPLKDKFRALSIAFSLEGAQMALGMRGGTIKIWDTKRYECLQTFEGHTSSVYSVTFSPDGARLASASLDSTVRIWDTKGDYGNQTVKHHSNSVTSLAFSPDLVRLASASDDCTIKIWDSSSGDCIQTFQNHRDVVNTITFSPDRARLASASSDSTAKIWDIYSGECVVTLKGHRGRVIWVEFSHDSTRLASASPDGAVKIWDVRSGECLATLDKYATALPYDARGLLSAAFSHDWSRLALGFRNKVRILDVGSGECQAMLEHNLHITSLALSPDSTRLALASTDHKVRIWNAVSGECLQTFSIGVSRELYKISFDSTGLFVYTDTGAIALNTSSVSNIAVFKPEPQNPQYRGLGLSSNGEWITYNSENILWLPPEYRPLRSVISGNMIGMGFGSGKVLICNLQIPTSLGPASEVP
ncbi:WD domain-containing protein [Cladophialophora immunda]|nr:WD domain-containing protein [Cladophialophora immunda]